MDQNAFPASALTAPAQPDYEGYIDQRSTRHIAGWARDINNPGARLNLEIILPGGVIATTADGFDDQTIAALGARDANYAFNVMFNPPLTEAERDTVTVRIAGTAHYLRMAHAPTAAFEPINHIAIDIVNNCNLRCPFCLYNYADTHKTEFMTAESFSKLLPLFPYVRDGNVWLSCLHEPTLHPRIIDFIVQTPAQYRKKIIFTTNLAKRMPDEFFDFLATSGIDHINISVESLQPGIYEKMRAGARYHIFAGNLEKLWRAFAAATRPPALRYIILAYRSNLAEIPEIVRYFLDKPATAEIEIRATMNKPHIPQYFRETEFLTSAEWRLLDSAMQTLSASKIVKMFPPGLQGYDDDNGVDPAGRPFQPGLSPAPRPLNLRVTWDGTVTAFSVGLDVSYYRSNLNDMADPLAALLAL
jgi:molybdenum cofactor biosynthesis enzyme MoaA